MNRGRWAGSWIAALGVMAALAGLAAGPGAALGQKYGGILKAVHRENPPGLLVHEWATVSASWPMMPVYNNLVLYNPDHAVESADDLVAELAEKWAWSDEGRKLTFTLRRGVTWHDGKPFTSADVKDTYDIVRDALTDRRLRTSPRTGWYAEVSGISTNGDYEVTFELKRPQPSLISMLASGYSMVIPAHVDPAVLRTKAIGTGPFMLKDYVPDQRIELVKNPNYFVKGRPYLDGITYNVIRDRSSRAAALIAGQIEIFFPQEGSPGIRDQVKQGMPQVVIHPVAQHGFYNIVYNIKKPPFDNLKVRQAINYALDRNSFLKTQLGGTVAGGVVPPQPYSAWGLSMEELDKLPGWGDGQKDKAISRQLLAEAGYGPDHPLQVKIATRNTPLYQDMASWMVGDLKQVGIEGSLEIIDTGLWFTKLQRGEYEIGANMTGAGAEDPDAIFFENYACGSPRNYSFYCNQEVEAMMEKMSVEQNHPRRLQMVKELDRRVQTDVARSILGHALDFVMNAPEVRGFVPHHSIFNYGRMQNVWLDR